VPRPALLGAIIAKAFAVDVDDTPDAQRLDLAFLLSLVEEPLDLAARTTSKDRRRLRALAQSSIAGFASSSSCFRTLRRVFTPVRRWYAITVVRRILTCAASSFTLIPDQYRTTSSSTQTRFSESARSTGAARFERRSTAPTAAILGGVTRRLRAGNGRPAN
jgi:hypothetical protein